MDDFSDLDALLSDDPDVETERQLRRPVTHERQDADRQFINGLKKQALTTLIPALPPPTVDLYVIGNGAGAESKWSEGGLSQAFDFGTFIPYLIDLLGGVNCRAYVSTWTMNRNHALALVEALDAGRLACLTVLCDPYFSRREPAVYAELITGMQRHADRTAYASFKNHVKAICISNADGSQTVTVTGSANLSAQPRAEQYILTTDPGTYAFFVREFFESMTDHDRR